MKYTISMKIKGEMACRSLNAEAQAFYCGTDPLTVYGYEKDGEELYDVALFQQEVNFEGLTFEELEKLFEEYADEGFVDDL